MARCHEDERQLFIEELTARGWATIEWFKVYNWYGLQRLSKAKSADLYNEIAEAVGRSNFTLRYIKNDTTITFFIENMAGDFRKDYVDS